MTIVWYNTGTVLLWCGGEVGSRRIETEKGTLGRFGLISGCMGIFGVTSMKEKCPKMLPQ